MHETTGERRLAENEVLFRQSNQEFIHALDNTLRKELDEQVKHPGKRDMSFLFYCECSDTKCKERVKMSPKEYESNHRQSTWFVLVPGHEIPEIEKVIKKADGYFVVQKYMMPPKTNRKLKPKDKNR